MAAENRHNKKLERLWFSYARGSAHASRTMMLDGTWRFRRSKLNQWITSGIGKAMVDGNRGVE